jgi:hypothetical protein
MICGQDKDLNYHPSDLKTMALFVIAEEARNLASAKIAQLYINLKNITGLSSSEIRANIFALSF